MVQPTNHRDIQMQGTKGLPIGLSIQAELRKQTLRMARDECQLAPPGNRLAAGPDSRGPAAASKMRGRVVWLVLLGTLIGGGPRPAAAAIGDYPFRLVTRGPGTDCQLTAENDGPAPITVQVSVIEKNLVSDRPWPVTAVVPAYTALPLGRACADGRTSDDFKVVFVYSYHFGRLDAVPDPDAAYRLPFEDGRAFAVTQAYGGELTTHNNRATMHAIDFAMPPGSAVAAARAGVVIDVTLRYREGGDNISLRDKANTIAIVHDDGTVAEYAHLSPGPALVTPGQRVATGELLAYSGSTGYSSGPHLHFIVSRPIVSDGQVSLVSVPVQFYANDPALRFSARSGTIVWANYGAAPATTHTADADAPGRTVRTSPAKGAGNRAGRSLLLLRGPNPI